MNKGSTLLTTSRAPAKARHSSPASCKAVDRQAREAPLPRTLKARSRPSDSALQRHIVFFDDNGDRGVDVAECVRGLEALGLPVGVAEAAALAADTSASENGKTVPALSVARVKSFYDGTLFYKLAREHARGQPRSG